MTRYRVALCLLVSVLALAACSAPKPNAAPASGAASGGAAPASAPAKAPGAYTPNGEADGSSGKVSLQMLDAMKYQPNSVTKVKPGQSVSVELKNAGATVHNFLAPGLGVSAAVKVNGGQTGTATFTAPSAPGTYQFWCNEPGHAEAGMVGQVVVQ